MKHRDAPQLNPATGLATARPRAVPERGKALTNLVWRFLLACLGGGCAVLTFATAFGLPVRGGVLVLALCLFIALLTGIFALRRVSLPPLLVCGAVWGALLWKLWDAVELGLFKTVSLMLALFESHSSFTFIDLGADIAQMAFPLAEKRVTLFLLFALFPWAVMFAWAAVKRSGFLLPFLLTAPFMALPLWFYIQPAPLALMGLFLYWGAAAFARLVPRRDGYAAGRAAAFALPALALLLVVVNLLAPAEGYQRSAKTEEVRLKAESWLRSLPSLLATDQGVGPAVSGGGFLSYNQHSRSFDNLGSTRFSGQTALRVKVENGGDGALYLKGYTGGIYTSGGWELAGDEAYAALAEACAPVDPQNLTAYRYGQWVEASAVTIRNQANKKTVYVPNWLVTTPEQFALAEFVGDGNIWARGLLGLDEYTVKYLAQGVGLGNIQAKNDIFLELPSEELAQQYDRAVYQYYTDVPEDLAPMLNVLLHEAGLGQGPIQGEEAMFGVSRLLGRLGTYTLNPGAAPAGRDFTEYFLTENQKGFCVHFATAGVLLMRSLGIPARYCEGYLVTPTDLRLKGSDGFSNIPDRRAHAWVEYYQAGVGWMTMECTPGFNPQSDVVQPNDVTNETGTPPQPTEPPAPTPAPTPAVKPTPEVDAPKEKNPAGEAMLAVLKVAIWPTLAVLAVLVRRRTLLYLRQKAFARTNPNGVALAVYVTADRLSPYVGEMEEALTALAQKARFSQHTLTDSELNTLMDAWHIRQKTALNEAGPVKKLWLIWGLCLEERGSTRGTGSSDSTKI